MFSEHAYRAAREHAALIDRSERGRVIVSGADRRSYLHALLTNDVAGLGPGQGCYAAYLTPQGRMIADLFVYEVGDVILLVVPRVVKDAVLARLDQFIFSEDVGLADVTGTFTDIAVVGPEAGMMAARVLDGTPADALDALPEHGNLRTTFAGQPAIATRITDAGQPGCGIYVDQTCAAPLKAALEAAGAVAMDPQTADVIRIEAGVALFGRDMDADTIPLEAGIESRAISFTKGCYVGQEVIIRILHRGGGRVSRKLVGLELDAVSPPPPAGTPVRADERDVGHVTSSAWSPRRQRAIALAYVQRDFVAPGTVVSVDGRGGVVAALPFVSSAMSSTSAGGNGS
jgi:folate-binding protein YgfZ